MPGVSLRMLTSSPRDPASLRINVSDGISTPVNSNLPAVQLPDIQLAGFADGSVRPAEERREGSFFDFRGGEFFSKLQPIQPDNAANIGWTGPVTFTDQDGNAIIAILIGLLQPSPTGGGQTLQGIIVVGDGTGLFAGAPGTGRVTINWGDRLSGPFDATIRTKPFGSERR